MSNFRSTKRHLHFGSCRQGHLLPQATCVLTCVDRSAARQGKIAVAFYLCNRSKSQAVLEFQLQPFGVGYGIGVRERRRLEPGETRLMLLGSAEADFSNQPSVWLCNLGANLGTEIASYECVLAAFEK